MKCKCSSSMHDVNGCSCVHDEMFGEICQPCYISCFRHDTLPGVKVIPCTHKRYKTEISFDEENGKEIKKYYCLCCSAYLDEYVKTHVLPPSDESITSYVINRWTPDTCLDGKCIVEYHWDRHSDPTTRTHNFHRTIRKCNDHKEIHGLSHHDTILKENKLKNSIHGHIEINHPEILDFKWKFEGKNHDRIINISHHDLTDTHKTNIKKITDDKFGVGKVKFST